MLAVTLDYDVENRLNTIAQTTGKTTDFLLNQMISQHLDDLENFYQLNNSSNLTQKPTLKARVSRAGALAQYANPGLIDKEKSAWGEAMLEKHG